MAEAGWYQDPQSPQGTLRYWDGTSWGSEVRQAHTQAESTVAVAAAPTPTAPGNGAQIGPAAFQHNVVVEVRWKGGWPGLFTGENQSKALTRALAEQNARGRSAVALATDRWSFWRKLGWAFVAVLTLGFVVRHENLLLVTEPLQP